MCPWPSICFHGPSGKFLDLPPPASLPPVQKRDAQHMFLQHKGSHTENCVSPSPPRKSVNFEDSLQFFLIWCGGGGGKTKFCGQEFYGHPDFSDLGWRKKSEMAQARFCTQTCSKVVGRDFYQTTRVALVTRVWRNFFCWAPFDLNHRKIRRKSTARALCFPSESRVARNSGESPF